MATTPKPPSNARPLSGTGAYQWTSIAVRFLRVDDQGTSRLLATSDAPADAGRWYVLEPLDDGRYRCHCGLYWRFGACPHAAHAAEMAQTVEGAA
jgi:hypothetical protein